MSHTLSVESDVVIPWTALASSQSKTRAHIAQVQCHSLLYSKFDEFLPLFMPEKNHMIAGIVTKVLLNPKVQTHWKAICGLKLTPHFTLFDPANMIPTLGNRGLPNSAML